MSNEALRLYSSRKSGRGQRLSWRLKAGLPTLLLLFISACLSFALVFTRSMADGLDLALQVMGSGTVAALHEPDASVLPEGAVVDRAQTASALAYSETGSCLVSAKGVEEGYFNEIRTEALGLELVENDTTLRPVIISRSLANELGVEPGGRMALMVYDADPGRARPVYLHVSGTYSTGYAEFDDRIVYTSPDVTLSRDTWEILAPDADPEAIKAALRSGGVPSSTYRETQAATWANINLSVRLLDIIVALIAFLAGFFAVSVSAEYIERDKRDIAMMILMGAESREMGSCYMRITMTRVVLAVAIGMAAGLALVSAAVPVLSSLDTWEHPALSSYVTNFSVHVPWPALAAVALALFASALASLWLSLRKGVGADLRLALAG